MDSSGFQRAEHVVARSAVAQVCQRAIDGLRDAASRSTAGHLVRDARVAMVRVPVIERIRLAGVVILTATATHAALLQLVTSVARPHAPWVRFELAALGLVLIVLAAPIGRGWPTSRAHLFLGRLKRPRAHA